MNVDDTTTLYINKETVNVNMKARSISKIMKRILDILAGIVGIVILIPLILVIKIANIFTKDKGPIFFIQERMGKNGKIFKMYKFRTMVVGAEDKLQELLQENEDIRNEYELNKKIKQDPRVTKIGNFLRKTSLDEFPQFINILKGEMSLVGPRPYLEREKKDIGQVSYNLIISMTPGLTGLWQISGRSNMSFEDRVKLDLEYYNKNSFFGDIKILFKTITAVLHKKGAM